MWDTVETSTYLMSHDLPCLLCGHAGHLYLPCSDDCSCVPLAARFAPRDAYVPSRRSPAGRT